MAVVSVSVLLREQPARIVPAIVKMVRYLSGVGITSLYLHIRIVKIQVANSGWGESKMKP